MHDYQLERLNTRSFEQLTQALALEVIGPMVMIFGDGPDGGREATFSGEVKYPSPETAWRGEGVLQAKFRQEPDSVAKKNADWALQQLKSEFAKFKPKSARGRSKAESRICPDYFVFATNVSLSAVEKKGGKDRVRAELEGYKKSHGLKDYAIWDGDQIRRFLDSKQGIRTTYAAWLTPGDVLAELLAHPDFQATDFVSTIKRYLESELLDNQFASLGQGGYTDAKNIPLSTVFIDLPLEYSPIGINEDNSASEFLFETDDDAKPRHTFLQAFFEVGRQVLRPSMRAANFREDNKERTAGRVVLIGGPGQGKTTVGQFACQLHRAALLKASGEQFSPDVDQALVRIDEMSDGLPTVNARRYPLRVDLKNLASALSTTGDQGTTSLFDYLVKRISARTDASLHPELFRKWLATYPWLLVLDGLDEVPASSNRQQVMRAIRDFVSIDAHNADSDLLVLATTRPQGYSDEFDPTFYLHLTLSSLEASEALCYGSRLAQARHPNQKTRIEELVASLKRATENPATVRLMQSPLQVTIMLALIEGGGEPPEQRWKLFRDYYDVIYRREKERGTAFSAILGRYEPDIHWIHHRAGWILQNRNAEAGKTDAKLTHAEFDQLVANRLAESGHEDTELRRDLIRTIRTAATDRLVLLVGTTESEIAFEIRSLQEFMAAEHIFDGGEKCIQTTIDKIAQYSYWRNVFLFVAGRILFERRELSDSLVAVCAKLNDVSGDPVFNACYFGSRVAIALLKDGVARSQPKYLRVFARNGAASLNILDSEVANSIALLVSGEAEEVFREELTRQLNPSTDQFYPQPWLLCLMLSSSKKWALDLVLDKFPWHREDATGLFIANNLNIKIPREIWDQYLSNGFFSHPPIVRRDTVGFIGDDESPLKQYFSWINDRPNRENHLRIPILLKNSLSETHLALLVCTTQHFINFPSITIPPTADPHWKLIKEAAGFSQNPTTQGLLQLFKRISTIAPDIGKSNKFLDLPWQISLCLYALKSGLSWQELFDGIEGGKIGDEKDWGRWEEKLEDGVYLSDLKEPKKFGIANGQMGMLCKISGWSFGASLHVVNKFITEITESIYSSPEISQQNKLLNLCSFALFRRNEISTGVSIDNFIDACICKKAKLDSTIVYAVLLSDIPTDHKLRLLSKLGSAQIDESVIFHWKAEVEKTNAQIAEIISALPSESNWSNVLLVLSCLPPMDAFSNLHWDYVDNLSRMGERFLNAAQMLWLKSTLWSDNDVGIAAALATREQTPNLLGELLDYIDASERFGANLEQFVLEITQKLRKGSFPERCSHLQRADSLLVKLIERRPDVRRLPDPCDR